MTQVAGSVPSSPPRSPGQKLRRKAPIQDTLNESSAVRLVEYFVVVSSRPRWEKRQEAQSLQETRQGSNGSDNTGTEGNIHMPTHQKHQDYAFHPQITARYPNEDYADNPLNPMILQFCYPSGDVITPTRNYHLPQVHHFVLTNEKGRKVYGTCLTVFEEYAPDGPWKSQAMTLEEDDCIELRVDDRGKALYIPKVLCLLSTWPYLTAFREYLAQIYRLATATNVMRSPIERYVVNLCQEIPAPFPGAYEVQVSILNSTIRFWAPPAKLPIAYVALPYKILFECLDVENILCIWSAMIVERKILLVSSQYSILTVCAEILCSLLFPLRWSHLYIPLLPKMLCPVLDAPVPFFCGIVRESWLHAEQFLSSDTIVVDLDRNSVQLSPGVPSVPTPPQKKWNKLFTTLSETIGNVFWLSRGMGEKYHAMTSRKSPRKSIQKLREGQNGTSQWNERLGGLDNAFNLAYTPDSPNLLNDTLPEGEQELWDRVQGAFHQFFVGVLKDYLKYLSVPGTASASPIAAKPSFDRIGFLEQQKTDNIPFLTEMCMSQQFDDFITRRMYSPGEPDLVFFDQSIDAKKNRSKLKLKKTETPFLQGARAHKELTKFSAVPPNEAGLTEYDYERILKPFVYKKWPDTFDQAHFSRPRPIPKMITAEFDRQSFLVAKLRATVVHSEEDDLEVDEIMDEFYGGDYDSSPEVASFTVFFFVYCALVGRDWQEYSQKLREEQNVSNREMSATTDSAEVRDEVEEAIETVLPDHESIEHVSTTKAFLSDISLGVCDSCPDVCVGTLIYIGRGAGESYKLFQETVEQVDETQRQMTAKEKKHLSGPGDNEAFAEYEEARAVASAQLDLAFQTLATLSLRGLSADSDSYLSLMEACGRCGDTKYALKLIELMKKDGFVADSEVLASFVAAFARDGEEGVDIGSPNSSGGLGHNFSWKSSGSDAYSQLLEKQLHAARDDGPGKSALASLKSSLIPRQRLFNTEVDDSSSYSSASSASTLTEGASYFDWFSKPHHLQRNGRRRRKKKKALDAAPVTEMLSRQLTLGEALLDFIYPNLSIDTNSDSCPHCSYVLNENEVVDGWKACIFQDYTTKCPKCQHRFVPRFIVSTSSPTFEGSQGLGTPLYCEFLSPWVLRKQVHAVIKGETGIDGMLKPEWQKETEIFATLFWNLMVLFRRYRLPFAFLLQGSVHNRLTLPRKPDEM